MASKGFFNSLEKGQIFSAVVEEVTSLTEVLCNFQGELLLISNYTGQMLKKGDTVQLQVVSVSPLKFEFFQFSSRKFVRVV